MIGVLPQRGWSSGITACPILFLPLLSCRPGQRLSELGTRDSEFDASQAYLTTWFDSTVIGKNYIVRSHCSLSRPHLRRSDVHHLGHPLIASSMPARR